MATVTTIDEVDGGQITQNKQGIQATRVATVINVGGKGDQKSYNALNAEGLPLIGSSHPTIPGATLVDKVAQAVGKEQFKVTLQYSSIKGFFPSGVGAPADVTINTTLQELVVRTHQYGPKKGEPIIVTYKDKSRTIIILDGVPLNGDEERTRDYVASATILVPLTKVGFRRWSREKPLTESLDYAGRINSRDWLVVGDMNAWLCTDISSISQDGGQTWITNYTFLLNHKGIRFNWDIPIIFLDPETGGIPSESVYTLNEGVSFLTVGYETSSGGKQLLQETNGVIGFQPYDSANFSELDLADIGSLGKFND